MNFKSGARDGRVKTLTGQSVTCATSSIGARGRYCKSVGLNPTLTNNLLREVIYWSQHGRYLPHHSNTKSGKTHVGRMNWLQPEVMNGFIGIAQEDGAWIYLAPSDVLKMEYVPEQTV